MADHKKTSARPTRNQQVDGSSGSTDVLTPKSMPFTSPGTNDSTLTSPSSAASPHFIDARASTAPLASAGFDDEEVILKPKKSRAGNKRKVEDSDFANDMVHDTDDDAAVSRKKKKVATRKPRIAKGTKAAIYYKNAQADKPEPIGRPSIFALTRQALCETVPWYKAYQSGPYNKDKIIYGLLCDQETDPSDWFDSQIIITRVGGGRELDATGKMVQAGNQKRNSRVDSFTKNMEEHLPIGVIVGQGNTNSPSKLPHYYNVLAYFQVTDMWCDISKGFSRWMVRLEKIDLAEKSWWTPAPLESDLNVPTANVDPYATPRSPSFVCDKCLKPSKQVYESHWVCLEDSCDSFLAFPDADSNETHHAYNPAFINERTRYIGEPPGPLAPTRLTKESLEEIGAMGYEIACRQGIVCAECGCCTRRLQWAKWVCENQLCNWEYIIDQNPVLIDDVISKSNEEIALKPLRPEFCKYGVVKEEKTIGGYRVYTYLIPGEEGKPIGFVNHLKPNRLVQEQENGPNDVFRKIQESGMILKRNPVRSKGGSPSEIMTAHWSANWGAPYKYRVTNDEKPFTEANDAILMTVKQLTWAGEYSLSGKSETFTPFNQCLSVGYFEKSYMGFHDDGEKMLGPTVASLSLGCPALMTFRAKANNNVGEKMASNRKNKECSLRIQLEHGDIMIMHGRDIQKFYEHKVEPHGVLRFALTCRYIRPETFSVPADRLFVENAGKIPSRFTYEYDGSIVPAVREPSTKERSDEDLSAREPSADIVN